MLPSRMQLSSQTEDQLKKLKNATGITPNVAARLAFFRSIETDFRYQKNDRKLDGGMTLDKITWLGETLTVTELMLAFYYPGLDAKELTKAWAAHVEDGIAALRNHRSLRDFTIAL